MVYTDLSPPSSLALSASQLPQLLAIRPEVVIYSLFIASYIQWRSLPL